MIPDQAHPVDRCETIRTGQGAISREARGHRQAQGLLDGVDGVFGHCPMCCPLPSHDADQTASRVNLQFIVTGELLGFAATAAAHQRPRPGETADDLTPGHGRFQILVELPENEVDFFLRYAELIIDADFLFRGADQQPSHPRDGEQGASVFRLRDQHRVLARKYVQRQENVATLAESHAAMDPRRGKIPNGIRQRASGIHKGARSDHERPTRQLIFHLCRRECPVHGFLEAGDPEVVGRSPARLDERLHQRDVVCGVVELPVGVGNGAHETISLERGHAPKCFLPGKEMAGENARVSGDPVIELQPDVVITGIQPVEAGNEELQSPREVRTVLQHPDSFVQRAVDDVMPHDKDRPPGVPG